MRWEPAVVLGAALAVSLPALPAPAAQTVVSLNFDDNTADHRVARRVLDERGLKGTFYVNSSWVGTSGFYLNRADLGAIAAAGHEIAGHSLLHTDLTSLSTSEMRRHVCDDRAKLQEWGFTPTAFAYPYNRQNASVQAAVRDCGYTNARGVGGLACAGCVKAEPLPPANAFAVRTPGLVLRETGLVQLKKLVTDAEAAGGGWLPFVFHRICNGCRSDSVTEADLTGFLDWLIASEGRGVVVRTMAQAMGQPASPPPPPPSPPPPPPPPSAAPGLSSLSPASWPAGGSAFNLTADGVNFTTASVVRFNAADRPGVLQGTTRLIVYIPPGDVVTAGTASVTVLTPGAAASNPLPFTVSAVSAPPPGTDNPLPTTSSLSPASRAAGGSAFNLTVDGVGFASGAVVRWNGLNRPGVRQGSTRLIVYIPPSDVASPGTASVAVFNPTPGGGVSNTLSFIVGSGTAAPAAFSPAADSSFSYREHYAFPNPSRRGQSVTFRLRPGPADAVEVRVYDVAGRLVHEGGAVAPQLIAGEITYDYVWDVSRVGSGVYIYSVTAKKAGEADVRRVGKVGVLK